uniref:Maco-A 25 n=2 Tax=Mamestra configurata nucleopolyhedrovirus TaxID=207830 RepID=A0A5B9G8H6_NPVMC|nr:Maco-A 25 [Mamestra configurata nucleopolyhedrovirus A]QNH90499.1 maco-A 25 [Mamestra configurata nucleopolyhedrovirus A]UVZ34859.1 hypothetical protein [Melanchra picta nucleopolyhedrovirus]
MSRVLYQSCNFDASSSLLVLLSQHLLQDNDKHKVKAVLDDLVKRGHHLCVVADRNVEGGYTDHYRHQMKKFLMKSTYPVKFARYDEYKGVKFAVDTDDMDRIDVEGPTERILNTNKTGPMYITNDYISDYYNVLIKLKDYK